MELAERVRQLERGAPAGRGAGKDDVALLQEIATLAEEVQQRGSQVTGLEHEIRRRTEEAASLRKEVATLESMWKSHSLTAAQQEQDGASAADQEALLAAERGRVQAMEAKMELEREVATLRENLEEAQEKLRAAQQQAEHLKREAAADAMTKKTGGGGSEERVQLLRR